MFPLVESAGERRVTLGGEVLEKCGGSLQDLCVDFGELVQGGDVAMIFPRGRRAEVTAAGRESVHRRRCVVQVRQVKEEQRGQWSTGDGRRCGERRREEARQ